MTPEEYRAEVKKPKKRSKYRNVKTVVDGFKFDSKREAARWVALKQLQRRGKISALRRQVPWPLHINGVLICKYKADFDYLDEDGRPVTEDSKGFETPEFKLKAKMFAAIYGRSVVRS